MIQLKLLVFLSLFLSVHGGLFELLRSTIGSLAAAAGVPQLDPLRMFEEGPTEVCPVVTTKMGKVQGKSEFSREKSVFFSYVGIPYAKPPVRGLRFEPPEPISEVWENIQNVVVHSPRCLQFDYYLAGGLTGDEDCLYLNVYTRKIDPDALLPVIVHIHGGGIMGGSSQEYHPRYFMDNPIVFVTMNYRVGALGFLNSGNGVIKGNMGLKDQKVALTWVQDNIANFGGDPQKVTLMGDGFGATCAHALALSHSAKGLFQRVILQSGTALSPRNFNFDAKSQFKDFSEYFDCPNVDVEKWKVCMKNKDSKQIVEVHTEIESPIAKDKTIFGLTVEAIEDGAIVIRPPLAILNSGKYRNIPMIIGFNEAEGTIIASRLDAHDELKKTLNIGWDTYVPIMLRYDPESKNVSSMLREKYLRGHVNLEENLTPIMQMVTDANFFYPTHLALNSHRYNNPQVYFYWYKYKGQFKSYPSLKAFRKDNYIKGTLSIASTYAMDFVSSAVGYSSISDQWGPGSMDQLFTLFYYSTPAEIVKGSRDYTFSKAFVKSLVDFASGVEDLQISETSWKPLKNKGAIEAMQIDGVPDMIDEPFSSLLPFYESLHIRDPPQGFSPAGAYFTV